MLFATGFRNSLVVVVPDHFIADVASLETGQVSMKVQVLRLGDAHRAKPTPRPVPELSRRILLEQTL